jgi:hypothetical protein
MDLNQKREYFKKYGLNLIKSDCPKSDAKDKSLPLNSRVVTLVEGENICYDIVQGTLISIFDAYYDLYRGVLKNIEYTEGRVNPKVYNYVAKSSDKKRK